MSLRDLADLAALDPGHLSRVERGMAGLSDTNLQRVADALHIARERLTQDGDPVKPQAQPSRGKKPEPPGSISEEDIHYTPEEVVDRKLLRCSARWLKDEAYARRIPHTKVANRIQFRLEHIRQIARMNEVDPALRGRRAA